jgi:hypothetical protein
VKLVREGNYPETAAASLGVNRATYYRWMERGEKCAKGDELFRDFRDALLRAKATAETKALAKVSKGFTDKARGPERAQWYLERVAPDRFGRRDKLVVENLVSQELDGFLARLEQRLDPETYERVLAALADDAAGDGAPEPPSSDEGRGGSPQDPLH